MQPEMAVAVNSRMRMMLSCVLDMLDVNTSCLYLCVMKSFVVTMNFGFGWCWYGRRGVDGYFIEYVYQGQ